jgi:hypothetical protein
VRHRIARWHRVTEDGVESPGRSGVGRTDRRADNELVGPFCTGGDAGMKRVNSRGASSVKVCRSRVAALEERSDGMRRRRHLFRMRTPCSFAVALIFNCAWTGGKFFPTSPSLVGPMALCGRS